jgi:hypothetical protein
METNQTTELCKFCGNQLGTAKHHLLKRSTNPELIDDPKNLVKLCFSCHNRTEIDHDFLEALQLIFYYWKPINLDLFLRAQASIDALLSGKSIEYFTPEMTDHNLQLASASYAFYSEQLANIEKLEAPYYLGFKKTVIVDDKETIISDKTIKMMWNATENGQKMIEYKSKIKVLEKIQSNLRSRIHRLKVERFNPTH